MAQRPTLRAGSVALLADCWSLRGRRTEPSAARDQNAKCHTDLHPATGRSINPFTEAPGDRTKRLDA